MNNRYWNTIEGAKTLELSNIRLRVNNNPIPLRIIDNSLSLPVKIIVDGFLLDNPQNVATYLFGHTTVPAAGSRFGNIVVTNGWSRLAESLQDNTLQPFLSGSIYDKLNAKMLMPVAKSDYQEDITTDANFTLT